MQGGGGGGGLVLSIDFFKALETIEAVHRATLMWCCSRRSTLVEIATASRTFTCEHVRYVLLLAGHGLIKRKQEIC